MAARAVLGPPELFVRIIVPSDEDGKRKSVGAPTRHGSLLLRSSCPKKRYSAPDSILLFLTSPQRVHTFRSS